MSENRVKFKIRCKYPEESKHRVREKISYPGCFKLHIPTRIEQCEQIEQVEQIEQSKLSKFDKITLIS